MKIRLSYYYQIRNFKPYMIPMSTTLSDPLWYHDFEDNTHIFKDKRGVLNGLRLLPIITEAKKCAAAACPECIDKNPQTCPFLKEYRQLLDNVDFDKMLKGITQYMTDYCKRNNITEEPIAVLMVYEAPNNPCSERNALIDYFNSKGIDCRELDYPIDSPFEN